MITPEEKKIAEEIFKYIGREQCGDNCDLCELLMERLIIKLKSLGLGLYDKGRILPFSGIEDSK